ncbi:hypothetical protein IR152_02630 [Clostridioides sp. ES-S-0108-01]|uniref:hypothetical protein n=1 Tax=unclassified Clostridioides TaxID=2635829 RepID=UPI001D0C662B|nr:hypothetical protein [Clostridioides sp. ES-S-0171-01]MCC0686664.1 hypothetical protein [Clostridioides sp. ES-S-0056-01]MCC0713819.1 hypothetical protein [Clostridioides sp. ES-S-0077-01]MCC0782026.1 hypothetical protein [Clostridioides sp. ES-S-0108-01]UDN51745.1 hypothetical protein JJC16_03445 [Clostridioides sp. ES-S-0107-01]UDN55243.1 hypothetical protein JJC02_03390 [Clostridioides sp. ES-S-0054-01]
MIIIATAKNIINEFYNLNENEKEEVIKELLNFNAKKNLDKMMDDTINDNIEALRKLAE